MINRTEIRRCYDFAVTAWNNRSQSQRQFGTMEERDRNSFIADQTLGKLAEYVFKHTIESKFENVRIELNFNHYLNPLHTDEGDVDIYIDNELIPTRIDIKGSSNYAQWLLVELHKFKDLETGMPLSDKYVMVKFDEDIPDNGTLRANPDQILELDNVSGEVIGWANHNDFISPKDNEEWFTYYRGERPLRRRVLPKSRQKVNDLRHLRNYINKVKRDQDITDNEAHLNVVLDAEVNIGLPIHWLNSDLEGILIK